MLHRLDTPDLYYLTRSAAERAGARHILPIYWRIPEGHHSHTLLVAIQVSLYDDAVQRSTHVRLCTRKMAHALQPSCMHGHVLHRFPKTPRHYDESIPSHWSIRNNERNDTNTHSTMTNSLLLLTIVLSSCCLVARGFQVQPITRLTTLLQATPCTVSVCTAELCCCQEEGMGGDEIFANLLERNLPYEVDEAPCLGACGGGAMVAIDFDDGSYGLVAGMEEVLMELGLEDSLESNPLEPTATVDNTDAVSPVTTSAPEPAMLNEISSTEAIAVVETKQVVPENPTVQSSLPAKPKNPTVQSSSLNDVRERMRAEAAKDEEVVNPWFNAASYLVGKAFGKD